MMKINRLSGLKQEAARRGMPLVGGFLIALRTDDVVSGLAMDAQPSATYIWTFILPVFDDIEFLHMTLGERVSVCEPNSDCLSAPIDRYLATLGGVKTADQLAGYLEEHQVGSVYALWCRALCRLRAGKLEEGRALLDELKTRQVNSGLSGKISMLIRALETDGLLGAQRCLSNWSQSTDRLLKKAPAHFEAFA